MQLLPCSMPYFEGEKTWKTGHCLEHDKCEYFNGMWRFILDKYPCYQLVKCLDIDRKDCPQPEALLKNKDGETMAIEMKQMPDPQFLKSSVKESEQFHSFNCSFWNNTLDDSALKAKEKFRQYLKEKEYIPNFSDNLSEKIINAFFLGLHIFISPKENHLCVRDYVFQNRKKFKPFLVDNMAEFCISFFEKCKSNDLKIEDCSKNLTFNNTLELCFCKTGDDIISFKGYDTTRFSLSDFISINEEGVTDYLKKFICNSDKKFKQLNKDTVTKKNILLITHDSTLSKATDTIENCLNKMAVPESIHEIWVTDNIYESVYNEDGDEDGCTIKKYNYRKIYGN